jgi:hypothetical protein
MEVVVVVVEADDGGRVAKAAGMAESIIFPK